MASLLSKLFRRVDLLSKLLRTAVFTVWMLPEVVACCPSAPNSKIHCFEVSGEGLEGSRGFLPSLSCNKGGFQHAFSLDFEREDLQQQRERHSFRSKGRENNSSWLGRMQEATSRPLPLAWTDAVVASKQESSGSFPLPLLSLGTRRNRTGEPKMALPLPIFSSVCFSWEGRTAQRPPLPSSPRLETHAKGRNAPLPLSRSLSGLEPTGETECSPLSPFVSLEEHVPLKKNAAQVN
ncbi:hypothetical protein MA16_Dca003035 [Dendrobium catenatum]|uniref:Uncharacterized protein n=1 Tax=Dendrobium catenatum TaxID=906689 RepID=A0A2I0X9E6_9ASPA|nr:hypothetical protein MA16_Dca003035 [Dendrobium catenatum]